MIVLKIGIPKDQFDILEDLARRAGCEDVTDLIEKALMLIRDAVECIEEKGDVFFRYGDGSIVCLRGIAPDAEDTSKPTPPFTPPNAGMDGSPSAATILIDIIRKLGWEGPALKIIHDSNS